MRNNDNHLIIFDLDGTLFQTCSITVPAVARAMTEMGLEPVTKEKVRSLIGLIPSRFGAALAPQASPKQQEKLMTLVSQYEKEFLPTHGRLYAGILEAMQELQGEGFSLYICTNGSETYAKSVLANCGINPHFQKVCSCADGTKKEAAIKAILKAERPAAAIVVGDRKTDIDAAKAAGCSSIGVLYGYGVDEPYEADFVAQTATDLVESIFLWKIFHYITQLIHQRKSPDKPCIAGINGVDLSGKTSFSQAFHQWLTKRGHHSELIHLDDFHNPRAIRRHGPNPVEAYLKNAFNLPLLVSEVLDPIKKHGRLSTELLLLDLESEQYTARRSYAANPETIVLLEGVLLFRKPIDSHLDLRIFLDIGFDEVLKRAEIRDVPRFGPAILDGYRRKYIPAQAQYLGEHSPKQRADVIIDNGNVKRPKLAAGENY